MFIKHSFQLEKPFHLLGSNFKYSGNTSICCEKAPTKSLLHFLTIISIVSNFSLPLIAQFIWIHNVFSYSLVLSSGVVLNENGCIGSCFCILSPQLMDSLEELGHVASFGTGVSLLEEGVGFKVSEAHSRPSVTLAVCCLQIRMEALCFCSSTMPICIPPWWPWTKLLKNCKHMPPIKYLLLKVALFIVFHNSNTAVTKRSSLIQFS